MFQRKPYICQDSGFGVMGQNVQDQSNPKVL